MTPVVGQQNQLVTDNVKRAQNMWKHIEEDYNPDKLREDAHAIYLDGLHIIKAEVLGPSLLTEELTPIMVVLNKVSACSEIQHSLHVLIPALKAHRVMTELTWVQLWKARGAAPIYTADRDALFRIASTVGSVLPKSAKVERGRLISPAGVRYEVACLNQAAKCLCPTDTVWLEFLSLGASAIGSALSGQIDVSSLFSIVKLIRKEWVSKWYIELFPLEWQATTIVTTEKFERIIQPHLKDFLAKGGKYTLGLVKILTIIFQNAGAASELKERVFEELVNLVQMKPTYSVRETLNCPKQFLDKLMQNPDRYAETRSFAAMALLDLASEPGNDTYYPKIKTVMEAWYARVQDRTSKKYLDEKREAQERAIQFDSTKASLEENMKSLKSQFQNSLMGPARGDAAIEGAEAISDKIDQNQTEQAKLQEELKNSLQEIKLAEALEFIDDQESTFLNQFFLVK